MCSFEKYRKTGFLDDEAYDQMRKELGDALLEKAKRDRNECIIILTELGYSP